MISVQPITNYHIKDGHLFLQKPSGENQTYRILGSYPQEKKTNYTHPASTIMGQTYSAPITTTVPHAAAPTPVSYPRPPYPATFQPASSVAPPVSASYGAPLILEAIPSPPIPATKEPVPYADPPATTTPPYAAPLLVANINISFPNNSSFKLTSSLHHCSDCFSS